MVVPEKLRQYPTSNIFNISFRCYIVYKNVCLVNWLIIIFYYQYWSLNIDFLFISLLILLYYKISHDRMWLFFIFAICQNQVKPLWGRIICIPWIKLVNKNKMIQWGFQWTILWIKRKIVVIGKDWLIRTIDIEHVISHQLFFSPKMEDNIHNYNNEFKFIENWFTCQTWIMCKYP